MERLRVHWSEFPASLTGALGQLQHAGELADVTLACEGQRIHAHKLVLSACSPYFRDAFKENPCHHPIIILKDVQADDILNLLSYMYQGEVNVEEDKLPSFIQTAELLQIKGLSTRLPTQTKKNIQKNVTSTSTHSKKSASQLTVTSKKVPSYQNSSKDTLTLSLAKTPLQQQKRRRNSASEKTADGHNNEMSKKLKPFKEKCPAAIVKKNDSNVLPSDNAKTESSNKEMQISGNVSNSEMTKISVSVSDEIPPITDVEIKHELEDVSDLEEDCLKDMSSDDIMPPSSPNMFYENSMLARSLISGAQSIKNDTSTNAMTVNKSKLPVQLVAPNVVTSRESVNVPSGASTKYSLSSDEGIKTEKLSPRPEVMELEPEVLISEQEDSLTTANRSLQPAKNLGQVVLRDQAGTSSSQTAFNQTNHAAICGDCPHCGTKYSNQSALKYHVRLMHSDLTNRLCCYLCPRSFTMRDTFKEHMWTSHGQRN